jgi:superfamily II DNA or RNA helicase
LPHAAAAAPPGELLYVLSAQAGATLTEVPIEIERRERKRDGTWTKSHPARLTIDAFPRLPDPDDRWALSLIYASSTYPRTYGAYGYGLASQPLGAVYLKAPLVDLLLPRLCAAGRVRLRSAPAAHAWGQKAERPDDVTLAWEDAPWRFELVVTNEAGPADGGRFHVDAVLTRGDAREPVQRFALLTDSLAILEGTAAPFDPAGGLAWAAQLRGRGAFDVPAKSRQALVEAIVRSRVAHVQLPDELRWEERRIAPRFVATIGAPNPRQWRDTAAIDIAADYDGTAVPPGSGESEAILSPDGRLLYRRDTAAELQALATLKRYGVLGLAQHPSFAPTIPARKIAALVHGLVSEGWRVEAEGVRYRSIAAPRLRVTSGIDWFDIEAASDTGAAIDVPDLLKALAANRRTVTLGDGTIGILPEEWLARVAPALMLGEANASGVRFKPSQVALIDALLAAQPAVDWDDGFVRARDALRTFEGVRAEDPPASFHGELREYQRESLGWMRFLRTFGFGGCLADDMGLGKTVMVLAMLEARRADPARAHRPSLIVLPRSLLFNWTSEAARFAPALRVLDFARADRHAAADAIAHADIVLTTYGTLRRDAPLLQDHRFDYVVLDEAQAIKNAGTATAKAVRLLRADHRLALTGTPIENHLGELHSLFDFLNPGLLGRGGVLDMRKVSADRREHIAALARGLRPFFLRRTKEQVAPELPPRTDETLYCELDGAQRAQYDELRDHYRQVLLRKIARDGIAKSQVQILEALLRLRQAACHTGLLAGGAKVASSPGTRRLRRGDAGQDAAPSTGASAKFDLLLPRLAELRDEGRKALVFSQFTTLLGLLRARLDAEGVVYEYLDGDTRDRAAHVTRFQDDPACPLFLISLRAGGVGLNLTAAEYVFLLDPWWNPAVEMQAIDRTHRIGQTKPVFAYRLVARDTVEERILELQAHKRELADAILDAGTGGLRGLQREDIEALLK